MEEGGNPQEQRAREGKSKAATTTVALSLTNQPKYQKVSKFLKKRKGKRNERKRGDVPQDLSWLTTEKFPFSSFCLSLGPFRISVPGLVPPHVDLYNSNMLKVVASNSVTHSFVRSFAKFSLKYAACNR